METVSGANNWHLTVRRCGDGMEILRAVTCDAAAALPETVLGLPVTALGRHALAAGDRTAAGEEVHITCGEAPREGWDNRSLRKLSLAWRARGPRSPFPVENLRPPPPSTLW